MKKINTFIIIVLLIALLTNPVFGYAGMGGNNTGANMGNITQIEEENIDLANTTQSDQNIILMQHLIEVDAAQFEEQNRIYVRETLLFKNIGDKHFSGSLRIWVPDGIEGIKVGKVAMMMGGSVDPINIIQNGNIISWQDTIMRNNPLPPMYAVEYVLPAQAEGSIIKSRHFSKKFVFPTLINKVPLNVVIKVTKGKDENVIMKDEKGNNLQSSGSPVDGENSVLYSFETPQFKEINIEFSKSALDLSQIALYLIIGLLIVLVLSYPVIRKKSPKLQEIEEKIRNSLKREPESEEQQGTDEEVSEEEPEEDNELLSKLEKLEKDYASGDLIDEEYEELRNSYQEKLKKIERKIE
ncbi:MAG: hypothetical protein Q8M95_09940 [Candidatus Methanoperedens sp.]|nr:hypothetical protein [Candidatus Methanoperedens sp.]